MSAHYTYLIVFEILELRSILISVKAEKLNVKNSLTAYFFFQNSLIKTNGFIYITY